MNESTLRRARVKRRRSDPVILLLRRAAGRLTRAALLWETAGDGTDPEFALRAGREERGCRRDARDLELLAAEFERLKKRNEGT